METFESEEKRASGLQPGNNLIDVLYCRRFRDNRCFKLIVFLIIVILDTADLTSDWLLYNDVDNTEEGLVNGSPEESKRYALLAFCIIGTLTIIVEIVNLWWETFRDKPGLDVDLLSVISVWIELSAVTVWFEDVPQITINFFIVACREEAISYFQLVKVSIVFIGFAIRSTILVVRYYGSKTRNDRANISPRLHVAFTVWTMIGLIITLGGAVAVFMFTQHERNPDGSLNFKVQHSTVASEYDDAKYFSNVSVYFSHELFDRDSTGVTSAENRNLLRLFAVNDIRHGEAGKTIVIQFDQLTGPTKVVIWESNLSGNMQVKECFQINRTENKVTIGSNCSFYIDTPINQFVFNFCFRKPTFPKLIFGDIRYNIKVINSSSASCKSPDFVISNSIKAQSIDKEAALHYFRTMESLDETTHVMRHASATDGTFFRPSSLQDINEVWKMGFLSCKSTGSLAPNHDESVYVPCI